jgi:thiamine biosynthesis lipoprotein ApbE
MGINYFIGREEPWLLEKLNALQEELAAGNTVTEVTTGDHSTRAQVQVNLERAIEMVLAALNRLNPTLYPNSDVVRITRTTPRYLC